MKKIILSSFFIAILASLALLYPPEDTNALRIRTDSSQYSDNTSTTAHNRAVDALDAVTAAVGVYVEELNKIIDTSDATQINITMAKGSELQDKILLLQKESFTAMGEAAFQESADSLTNSLSLLLSATQELNGALASQNANTINASLGSFNTASESLDQSVALLNQAVDTYNAPIKQEAKNTGTLYVFVTIATTIITILTFTLKPRYETAREKALRIRAGKQSFWPLGGALITCIWFFASSGDYLILWGAIAFGFIIYIQAISEYFSARKNSHKDIAQITVAQARRATQEIAETFDLTDKDLPALTLLVTLSMESLYAFSLFNAVNNVAFDNNAREERLSSVQYQIDLLAGIDGSAIETKEARDKIYRIIMETTANYADSSIQSRLTFAVLGATTFLVKEYFEDFKLTSNDTSLSGPVIDELAIYQQSIATYL